MLRVDINKMHDINKIHVNIIMLDVDIIDLAYVSILMLTIYDLPIPICICQHAL